MKIKKINIKSVASACAVMVASMMSGNASAVVGWPTVNMNDPVYYPLYFGPMGLFTNAMGKQHAAVKGAVDSVRTVGELQIKQNAQNQHDTDVRLRMALGQADIAKRDFEQMPTLAQCVELSKGNAVGSIVTSAANKSGGGSGASSPQSTRVVTNPAISMSTLLKQKAATKTCSPEMSGVAGCPGNLGDTADPTKTPEQRWIEARDGGKEAYRFLGADFIPYGILGNTDSKDKKSTEYLFKNYTMKKDEFETVADKYTSDATFSGMPQVITTEAAKKRNPLFFAKYYAVLTKLNAANYVLRDIAKLRLSAGKNAFDSNSIAGKANEEMKAKYEILFPTLTTPEAPSFYELIRFKVYSDMFGDVNDMTGDSADTQEAIMRKIALNNLLQLKNFENTEKTNILLSHILVQLTNPVSAAQVAAEARASEQPKSSDK